MSVRVLVVDDSAFFRKRVSEILGSVPEVEVIGAASNGREALEKVKTLKPDVITMDYEMPVMDGVTAVRHIMLECPTPILMFSSLTYEGARVTLDALEAGAVDFLPKNFEDISRNASRMQEVLKERILQVAGARRSSLKSSPETTARRDTPQNLNSKPQSPASGLRRQTGADSQVNGTSASLARPSRAPVQKDVGARSNAKRAGARGKTINHPVDILLIGTSTGGPVALQKIVSRLPASFPVPILLIQHMPATFTPAFAERLNSLSALHVRQAENGDELRPGSVFLAPGGKQMMLKKEGRRTILNIIEGDERLTYKPSVDLTFGSAARIFPGRILSIVLTGMGADGREGCRLIKASGATVWTQDEKSCVVYGMPMAVDKAGYSDLSLPISDFAERLVGELS